MLLALGGARGGGLVGAISGEQNACNSMMSAVILGARRPFILHSQSSTMRQRKGRLSGNRGVSGFHLAEATEAALIIAAQAKDQQPSGLVKRRRLARVSTNIDKTERMTLLKRRSSRRRIN